MQSRKYVYLNPQIMDPFLPSFPPTSHHVVRVKYHEMAMAAMA